MTAKNGVFPAGSLLDIGGGKQLKRDAGLHWLMLSQKAQAAGYNVTVTDAARLLAVQEKIFFDRYIPQATGGGYYGDVKTYKGKRYVRRAGTASAATPGTSVHGWGNALDLGGLYSNYGAKRPAAYLWMSKNAGKYGYVNPAWASTKNYWEPWHWEFSGKKIKYAKKVAKKKLGAYDRPGGKRLRWVKKGTKFQAVVGSRVTYGKYEWLLTRSGVWVPAHKVRASK